jgi:hypothetical protein
MLINFYFNHFVLRALNSELFQLLWCLITTFLQYKMNFFRQNSPKVLWMGAENSSSGEQFPTLSDFRSLQNFEKLSFKEELFSLPWTFRTYQWWTILFSAKVWLSALLYTVLDCTLLSFRFLYTEYKCTVPVCTMVCLFLIDMDSMDPNGQPGLFLECWGLK